MRILCLVLLGCLMTGLAEAAPATIAERIAAYGPAARARLAPDFAAAGIAGTPKEIALIGIKDTRELQLYARAEPTLHGPGELDSDWVYVHTWPILAASGGPGPKLREGDRQVPEGCYGIELLNPNSRFHLSLRVNYPNATDRAHAKAEGRTQLGGDIMIHGNQVSIGCLALGDPGIEELFVLAHDVGLRHITVLFVPTDFRLASRMPMPPDSAPAWTPTLWSELALALEEFPSAHG